MIHLDEWQERVLLRARAGESLLFLGGGGSGKTALFRAIIKQKLEEGILTDHIAILAPTNQTARALHSKAKTINSFLGIGIEGSSVWEHFKKLLEKRRRCKDQKSFIRTTDILPKLSVLILDEVNFLCPLFLQNIHRMLEVYAPHVQIIAAGDFSQLPSIQDKSHQSDNRSNFRFSFQYDYFRKMFILVTWISQRR